MSQVFRSTTVDLSGARYLRVDLARSRVRIVRAEVRIEDERRQSFAPVDVKIVDGTTLIVPLDPSIHRGARKFELRVDVAFGRAIPAFVTLFGESQDLRAKEVMRVDTGAHVVPDWLAGSEVFTDRFGAIGELKRSAFEIPVEFVWVPTQFIDLLEELRKYPITLGPFDVDGARGSAAAVVCAIGDYFKRLEYLTTEPGAGSLGFASLAELQECRELLTGELTLRAASGKHDKRFVSTLSGSAANKLFCRIDAVTKVFEEAETLLPSSVPAASPFEWAYELFVAGRLAIAHSDPRVHWRIMHHGAPDGSPFLLFAQLASNAISLGSRADFWRPRIGALIRAAVLFQAFPASDAARSQEYFVDGALPDDVYAFFDGKTIPLRVVFELRRTHRVHFRSKSAEEELDHLERAFTWVAGRLVDSGTIAPDSSATALNAPAALLVPQPTAP
jgi:hypothetical protein